ncbi:MAG TPA: acyl-CoA dehydrogenase [Pseudonocardiaceae bacterium]|nr:acyl-CoA dehydrogenase [Pseudonocardiaceae bacterium]
MLDQARTAPPRPGLIRDALPADVVTAGPRAVWRALGESGAISRLYRPGPPVRPDPEALRTLLAAVDERCPLGVTLSVCVQAAVVVPALLDTAGEPAKSNTAGEPAKSSTAGEPVAEVARRARDGSAVTALAATDRDGAGSDLTAMGTRAELTTDGVRLDGGKRWIVNATTADHLLVLARHRPGQHFTSFVLVLVPATAPGVSTEPAGTDFFAGSGVGHVRLDGVRLGRDHLVGRPGHGLVQFANRMVDERLAGGLWASALCRRVLARTHRRLRERQLGGRPLWHNEAVRHAFARCLVVQRQLEALAGWAAGRGAAEAMLLKAAVPEAVDAVLGGCARLGGADAFEVDGLHRLRAEAAMFGVAGGTADTMLAGVADHADRLLGEAP